MTTSGMANFWTSAKDETKVAKDMNILLMKKHELVDYVAELSN